MAGAAGEYGDRGELQHAAATPVRRADPILAAASADQDTAAELDLDIGFHSTSIEHHRLCQGRADAGPVARTDAEDRRDLAGPECNPAAAGRGFFPESWSSPFLVFSVSCFDARHPETPAGLRSKVRTAGAIRITTTTPLDLEMANSPLDAGPTTGPRTRPSALAVSLLAFAGLVNRVAAQDPPSQQPTWQQLLDRMDAQDRTIEELNQRLGAQASGAGAVSLSYKNGYLLRSTDPTSPFELRINGRMQFRYTGWENDRDAVVQNQQRSDFEIERGRLEFRGTLLDKKTHFYINLDSDTDDGHAVIFHDFWFNYDVCKSFSLYAGKAFFPNSRDWISGSTSTHLIDRSLATSFFRQDRTLGIWAIGKLAENVNYRAMIGNGLATTDQTPSQIDHKFAYAASLWWDPLANYGSGYADLEQHEDLALRVGTTFSYAQQEDGQLSTNREEDVLRLSDGTRLTDIGADQVNFSMGTFDAAMKFQGFSANCEMFYRSLNGIRSPTMPAIDRSHYDWGGYCDVGYMLIPKTLEPVVRVSTIQGDLADYWEYAGGLNYYVEGSHMNKLTVDVTHLDGSPVSSSGPGYRIGDHGWLFRMQWQIAF
jgi:hypothetical protein